MNHKSTLDAFVELRIAVLNLKVEVLKGLIDSWVGRVICKLLGIEEILIIQDKEELK